MAALIVQVRSTNSYRTSDNILTCNGVAKRWMTNFGQQGVIQEAKGSRKTKELLLLPLQLQSEHAYDKSTVTTQIIKQSMKYRSQQSQHIAYKQGKN
jgi:hypothetical protein